MTQSSDPKPLLLTPRQALSILTQGLLPNPLKLFGKDTDVIYVSTVNLERKLSCVYMAWFKGIVESSPSCWTSTLWGAQGKSPIIPSTISKGGGRKEASEQNNGSRGVFSFLKSSKCWLCKIRKNPKCPRNGLSTYTSPEWSHYSLRGLYWQQSSLSTIVPWLWAKCLFKHF